MMMPGNPNDHMIQQRPITLGELTNVLDQYCATSKSDADHHRNGAATHDRHVMFDGYSFHGQSSSILKKIHNLMEEMKILGINAEDCLPEEYQLRLADIVREGEQSKRVLNQVVCKRIAALMHLDMYDQIDVDFEVVFKSWVYLVLTLFLLEDVFNATRVLALWTFVPQFFLAEKCRININDLQNCNQYGICEEIKDQSHFLNQACKAYSKKLGISPPPKLFFTDQLNAFAYPYSCVGSPNGFVIIGKELQNKLDKEELLACLAHELGHIHDILVSKSAFKRSMRNSAMLLSVAMLFWAATSFSTLLTKSESGEMDAVSVTLSLLNHLLLMGVMIKLASEGVNRKEVVADAAARQLVGSIQHASVMRSMNRLDPDIPQLQSRTSRIMRKIRFFGVDANVLGSHPSYENRMKP